MRIYDPNEVILSVGGADIDGFAPGSFITLEMAADGFISVVGSRGDVARSKTSNKMARLTVRLMQTSLSNNLLSTIHNLDLNAPNGAGVFALAMRDSSNGEAFWLAAAAWIVKAPSVNFDASDTPREWIIDIEKLERFDAGVPG